MQKTGYTLIEVLFTVVLLAIIAGVALPRVGYEFTTKMKVKTTAQKLVVDLRYTRRLAITNHDTYRLSTKLFTGFSSGFHVFSLQVRVFSQE